MIYEIINPSDKYTLEAGEFLTACIACVVVGGGQYSLEPLEEGGEKMPLFLFGGGEAWFEERFGKTVQELFDNQPTDKLAQCLESVMIGGLDDRKNYYDALALIDDPAKKQEWRDKWHDQRRSSLNDIGGRAWKFAERLRETA